MNITIERKALKEAVAGLSKIVPRRVTLPVLGCVRIESADDTCTITATDLEQTAAYKAKPIRADGTGVLLVPFETLNLLAKGQDAEPVTFGSARKKELTILNTVAGQEVSRTVEMIDPDEWPSPSPASDVGPVDPAFLVNFRRAALFASEDSARQILNGVFLQPDAKNGDHVVATDGRRMSAFNTITLPFKESCVVAAHKFLLWTKLVPAELFIGHKPGKEVGWFRLVTTQWDYRCRTVQGTYPNWKMVVPADGGVHQFTLSETDAETLRKILPTFAGHDAHNQPVTFELRDSKTFISGKGENDRSPSTLELAESRSVGPSGRISAVRGQFLDALTAGFRCFAFDDELSPLHSRSADGGVHVLMPLRPDKAPSSAPQPAAAQATAVPQTSEPPTPKQKEEPMKTDTTNTTATQPTALERVLEAYELAKAKVREANEALAQVAAAVKDALREDKARRQEVEGVRNALTRLQAIKV